MITKSKPSVTLFQGQTTKLKMTWTSTGKDFLNQTYSANRPFLSLSEVITYDRGPRRIGENPIHPNWKRCTHVGKPTRFTGSEYHSSIETKANPFTTYVESWGANPFAGYPWQFPAAPTMPKADLSDLYRRMYSDLAGRVDSYFLSLEDLAGVLSGRSFIKTVFSTASAANRCAVAIAQLKRLKRRFGWRSSLYQMWTRSSDLVRELAGLRLGYRFAFKATLHDIVEAVNASLALRGDVNRLNIRNNNRVFHYLKTATAEATSQYTMSGSEFHDKFAECFAEKVAALPPAELCPDAILKTTARCSVQLHCWARVRYPERYVRAARILQSRFGLDKPLSTLWAIVPCSFLIDYLLNVQELALNVDNAMNEYDVLVNIGDAWLLKSETRTSQINWPGLVGSHPSDPSMSYNCPPLAATRIDGIEFNRWPITSADIMANSSALIRTDDHNWLQRIGTGLELLLSRRRNT